MRALVVMIGLVCVAPLLAEPPDRAKKAEFRKPAPAKFMRLQRDGKDQPVALETAIVRYVPASGEGDVTVDLVAAVHVGDKAYYEKLNKQFRQYDVLLYELVAPPGTRIPKGGRRDSGNPLALIQQMMKLALDLESQTERIDYTKKNFVHADLSPQQMAEAVRKRGDNGLTLILGIAADLLRQQNLQELKKEKGTAEKDEDVDLGTLLLDPDGPIKLKRMMAQQFVDMDIADGGLGHTISTILITDRNKAALQVLQKELVKGKKKIGIFYGAAHMPDFDKRLKEEFGLKRSSEQWLTAWDLKQQRKTGLFDLFKMLDQ
jgi:hypothetical protein